MFFNPNNLFIGIFCLYLFIFVYKLLKMKNKEQQKQHLIDMMKSDEELGLYDESREIKFEDVFNDDKKEKLKTFISEHKKKNETNI